MVQSNLPNRRNVIAGTCASFALIGLPVPALALTGRQAKNLITQAVDEINKIIASGKSEAAMLSEFKRTFERYADVQIVALTTLGAARRSASDAQVKAYTAAFKDYFTWKYGRRFREFIGGEIIVKETRNVKSYVEVDSIAKLQGSAPFDLKWLVSDRSGSPKIFNMIIEGVNMLTSERAEIGAMLDKRGGNIDRLTADLRRIAAS